MGFIATHQDTLVGEGMQVIHIATAQFTGDVLAINHAVCGKNYKAGYSLWDVTNPLKPKKLSEHMGDFTVGGVHNNTPHDVNQYHSVFMWQDVGRAYLSYYAGGIRALEIQCAAPNDTNICELLEVGGYLDPDGDNFWGIEVGVIDGVTYIFGSDRDSGLWIFRDTTADVGGITAASLEQGQSRLFLPLTLDE